jgi:spore germination protein
MQIHVVKKGETLWEISRRFGIPIDQIISVNELESPEKLVVGQALIIPTTAPVTAKPVIDVNAYTINTGETGAEEIHEVGKDLTYWMPFAYRMTATGGLEAVDDSAMIQAAIAERVVPVLCITNFSATEAGSTLAHTILSNNDIQERLLTNIITLMKEKGYRGINIDFENVLPADRVLYNQFLQRTVDRLHPEGYFVSTALAPKVSAEQKGLLYEAHDYEAHGRIVDFVVLMTYEWGYRLGPPQAISPLNQTRTRLCSYCYSSGQDFFRISNLCA